MHAYTHIRTPKVHSVGQGAAKNKHGDNSGVRQHVQHETPNHHLSEILVMGFDYEHIFGVPLHIL